MAFIDLAPAAHPITVLPPCPSSPLLHTPSQCYHRALHRPCPCPTPHHSVNTVPFIAPAPAPHPITVLPPCPYSPLPHTPSQCYHRALHRPCPCPTPHHRALHRPCCTPHHSVTTVPFIAHAPAPHPITVTTVPFIAPAPHPITVLPPCPSSPLHHNPSPCYHRSLHRPCPTPHHSVTTVPFIAPAPHPITVLPPCPSSPLPHTPSQCYHRALHRPCHCPTPHHSVTTVPFIAPVTVPHPITVLPPCPSSPLSLPHTPSPCPSSPLPHTPSQCYHRALHRPCHCPTPHHSVTTVPFIAPAPDPITVLPPCPSSPLSHTPSQCYQRALHRPCPTTHHSVSHPGYTVTLIHTPMTSISHPRYPAYSPTATYLYYKPHPPGVSIVQSHC
ncbi:hypothetical protein ACOMHN_009512 [Nucella lapillus]